MIALEVGRGGRLRARFETALPVARSTAWKTLADFERMACMDHFHQSADLGGRAPRPGVEFDLPHRALGRRFARHGRILRWEEGTGYAFSDLADSPDEEFFAHIFRLWLTDDERSGACRFTLEIRGRWTVRWLPRWAARAWFTWNVAAMGRRIRIATLRGALDAPIETPPARWRSKATGATPDQSNDSRM